MICRQKAVRGLLFDYFSIMIRRVASRPSMTGIIISHQDDGKMPQAQGLNRLQTFSIQGHAMSLAFE